MNRILNINALDTVHDFAKGKRVSKADVKKYIMKDLFTDIPAGTLHPTVKNIATNKSTNVEHLADEKINLYNSTEYVSFQQIANDVDIEKHINYHHLSENTPRKVQPMKRITIPYSFLHSLPAWMMNTFSQYRGFTLDITVLPESMFCEIPNNTHSIHKSLATMYDRVAYNTLNENCIKEHTPDVTLLPGEVLFLSEVSMSGSGTHTISWKYNDQIHGLIDIDAIIAHRDKGKSLTLFGNMIAQVLDMKDEWKDVLAYARTQTPQRARSRSRSPVRRDSPVLNPSKLHFRKTKTAELLVKTSALIKTLYGLDLHAFENNVKDYIGILTDFKRMGDLLQIKVAKLSGNVYVTNDIVSSIMASIGYNCPTMRTAKRFGSNDDEEDNNQHSDRTITLFQVNLGNVEETYKRMVHTLQQYASAYKHMQSAKLDEQTLVGHKASCETLLKNMMTMYKDTYDYISDKDGDRGLPKQLVNLGLPLLGITIVHVQQMIILLQTLHNISHANFDAFQDIRHRQDTSSQKKYQDMLAFFAKNLLPLPNTLFTAIPESIDLNAIIDHIRVRIGMIEQYVTGKTSFASVPFEETYKFMSFTDDPFAYIPIVDLPSKSLLPYARLLKSFASYARPVFYLGRNTGCIMEVGWDRDANHKNLQVATDSIETMIRDNQKMIHTISPMHGGVISTRPRMLTSAMMRAPHAPLAPSRRTTKRVSTRKNVVTFTTPNMALPAVTTIQPRKGLPSPSHVRMGDAVVELERVNLIDVFLDMLWMKGHMSTTAISPSRKKEMTVLFFQLSLLKDVLRWDIPVMLPKECHNYDTCSV